mmetsp:Transcript_2105/g.4793  ORF Transcript_2105/g.4793 Transcript_2105/m.4793 type:complete len:202 (-) Transcript_2105:561-1166(-)
MSFIAADFTTNSSDNSAHRQGRSARPQGFDEAEDWRAAESQGRTHCAATGDHYRTAGGNEGILKQRPFVDHSCGKRVHLANHLAHDVDACEGEQGSRRPVVQEDQALQGQQGKLGLSLRQRVAHSGHLTVERESLQAGRPEGSILLPSHHSFSHLIAPRDTGPSAVRILALQLLPELRQACKTGPQALLEAARPDPVARGK